MITGCQILNDVDVRKYELHLVKLRFNVSRLFQCLFWEIYNIHRYFPLVKHILPCRYDRHISSHRDMIWECNQYKYTWIVQVFTPGSLGIHMLKIFLTALCFEHWKNKSNAYEIFFPGDTNLHSKHGTVYALKGF